MATTSTRWATAAAAKAAWTAWAGRPVNAKEW